MYLQVQYHLGCWMHCLFALLGETLHTHFTCSGWIVCTLTSFIDCPLGTETNLESIVASTMSAGADVTDEWMNSFSAEILSDYQKEKGNEIGSPTTKFVPSTHTLDL